MLTGITYSGKEMPLELLKVSKRQRQPELACVSVL